MSKSNELLGVDPRIDRPNAYQLFGLDVLESDEDKIQSAINQAIRRLKKSRDDVDPAVWTSAAKRVKKAQKLLTDPAEKAQYDERLKSTFESVAVTPAEIPEPVAAGGSSFLDGWLPAGDPFAAFDMAAALEDIAGEVDLEDDTDEDSLFTEPELKQATEVAKGEDGLVRLEEPESPFGSAFGDASATSAQPAFKSDKKKRRKRKKGFPVAGVVMTLFVLGMFGGIAYCVQLLVDRDGNDGQMAAAPAMDGPRVEVRMEPKKKKRPRDSVMGNLLPAKTDFDPEFSSGIQMDVRPAGDIDVMSSNSNSGMSSEPMSSEPEMVPEPDSSPEPGMFTDPAMTTTTMTEPAEPTADMVAAGNKAAEEARAAIRTNDWANMMALADKSFDLAANDEQRAEAEARRRLVHYASEYQAAIDRTIDGLTEGERIEIREGVIMVPVEVTPDTVALMMEGTRATKTHQRKRLLPILANAFAPKALERDEVLVTILRGAWTCLHPDLNNDHRAQAFEEWQSVAGRSIDPNADGLQQEVEAIFGKQ